MDINNIVNSTRIRNARLLDDIKNKILNREYYKFKYLPLEGALPGLYFQQQTEDAINDIGNVAYATEQVADEALKIAQQAYNIALAALETANNALAAAQTAQQTADTALNIAKNALSVGTAAATAAAAAQKAADAAQKAADAAQKTADAAQKTADAAQKAADSAANDATNALTKAEDALTKIEQLSVLNYYNNLTEATDVNTLVDIHRWYLQASNNPNAPETNPGFLNVDNDYNDSVCKQLWVSETTGAIYNRFGQIVENSDPATVSSWSEWYKLATKADIDRTTTDLTKKITTVANNALAAAQTAQQTADTALNIAKNALSVGTAAATAAAAAQKAADAAQKAADAAQKTADAAQKTADAAQKAADSAANDATNALTKAEDALTKIEQLSVLNYYNNLTEATDVNTLVDIHRWYLQASNNPNAPETNPGFLNVDNDYNDSVCKQLWVSETTGAIYNRFGQIVENSDPATVSSWSEWYKLATKADIDGTTTDLTKKITTVANNLATHEADFNNPHKVTAEQLGLTTVYQYKGSVATYADLPTTGQKVGDVWNVETADPDHGIKAGDNVAWDGAQWDTLGGNHDLSGYAQLNSANTFTALNTFRANIKVSNGDGPGSSGSISFGISPADETVQARIGTDKLGGLFYHASTNQPHVFRIGTNDNVFVIRNDDTKVAFSSNNNFFATVTYDGVAKWLGNANTATKLETARKINGVAFDGTKDITIKAGGDVTAAGDNYFTGKNTFNRPITVRDGELAGIGGTITLGTKPNSATTQAKINSTTTGAMYYTATEGLGHFFNVGTAAVATIGGTATTATLDFLANSILKYSTSSGLRVGGGGTSKIIGFYPEAADNTAGMRLSNQAEAISTDYSIFSLQNNSAISYTKNAALQVGNFKILEVDRKNNNVTIKADSNGQILFTPNNLASNTSSIDSNGNFYISQGLTVGSTLNTGTSNGVIRAGNNESCLYFTGTAENTYYATPNTGNTISYQSAANCYLINCSINNPSSLKMNFSNMNFKATVGSVPYMCKTLTFWLPVGATVPAVTWTFPTGSAVYYPKGVAPTLTANANNIINVIAIVDDTGSFSIQVCDTVVLPYSG